MKKFQRGFVITLAAAFLVSSTMATTVIVAKNSEHGANKIDRADDRGNSKRNGEDSDKKSHDSKPVKDDFKVEKSTTGSAIEITTGSAIEVDKESLKAQEKALKEQYKVQVDALKDQFKEEMNKLKAEIKAKYSNQELENLKLVSEKIKKNNKNITVLSVDNIIAKGVNIKFDTPPVIKSGRTLIPVKALSQAFGANVQWLPAEKKVIITKGDKEIVLTLDSNKIYVNGVEAKIDVPACSINGRTVVPMKFIVEQLGLKVNWHSDTKDIEIEDPADDDIPPVTTTGSAITVSGSAITVGQ